MSLKYVYLNRKIKLTSCIPKILYLICYICFCDCSVFAIKYKYPKYVGNERIHLKYNISVPIFC